MERDSFVYYRSFYEATKDLPKEVVQEFDQALKAYALDGVEPNNLSPVANALFMAVRPQIDANNRRYANGCKGGAPAGNQNARKQPKQPKVDFENNQKQPNVNDNVNDNVNVNVNDNVVLKENSKRKVAAKAATKEQRAMTFYNKLVPYVEIYGKEMVRDFYNYWTESNENGQRMRHEMERVFNIKLRLANWSKRQKEEIKNGTITTTSTKPTNEELLKAVAEGYARAHTQQY